MEPRLYVTSPLTNLHWYRHFSIRYAFCTNTEQMIIKTESTLRVLVEQNLHGHTR